MQLAYITPMEHYALTHEAMSLPLQRDEPVAYDPEYGHFYADAPEASFADILSEVQFDAVRAAMETVS